ncbi:hypothetical protein P280DRAFT_405100, partial [Massarina eburnea CBS 473.64]
TFQVHKGLLTHHSPYFCASLKDFWAEGATNTVRLPTDNPKVFSAFFHWLYSHSGALYSGLTPEGKIPLEPAEICGIYVFGDTKVIPELCNAAIDLLFQKTFQNMAFLNALTVAYIYDNTMEKAMIRKLIVDYATRSIDLRQLRGEKQWPHDFFVRRH